MIAQKQIWFGIPLFLVFIMFFISCLAETKQVLFDLSEAGICRQYHWLSSMFILNNERYFCTLFGPKISIAPLFKTLNETSYPKCKNNLTIKSLKTKNGL
jgi:NADH:ubiquinone oxidoreductase subunit H